jgi:hypothetical protein
MYIAFADWDAITTTRADLCRRAPYHAVRVKIVVSRTDAQNESGDHNLRTVNVYEYLLVGSKSVEHE